MSTLLETPQRPLSIRDLADISRELATDVSRLVFKTEGFSDADYLSLNGPYFVEYFHGCLQVLPMPTALHQAIAFVLANLLIAWSKHDPDARTKLPPFPVQLDPNQYREPDVCFMLGKNATRRHNGFWEGADLVIEVISPNNRNHDYVTKRAEYAAAGIPEYWIVDPEEPRCVTVLALRGKAYARHGEFKSGQVATSMLLDGFAVDVDDLFIRAAAQA